MVLVEGEEQVFESGEIPNVEDGIHLFTMDAEKNDAALDTSEPNEGTGEMQEDGTTEEEAAREKALEEWNTFREEHLESPCTTNESVPRNAVNADYFTLCYSYRTTPAFFVPFNGSSPRAG